MRRLFKFLHTLGAAGFMGAISAFIVLLMFMPPVTDLANYAAVYRMMADISRWVFFPSLALTLIAGLLSIYQTTAFQNAGWVGVKALTGILIFEGGLLHVHGAITDEAKRSARALAGQIDPVIVTSPGGVGQTTLWVLLAVAAANIALAIWRPRFSKRRD